MGTTAALFGALFAVLLVLELVDAVLSSVLDGAAAEATTKSPRSPTFILLILIGWVGSTIGLLFHELAHAVGQFVFGGRPKIVLLKNGGFAQASPWLPFAPFKVVYVFGQSVGIGLIGLAPALFTAAAIGGIALWASPLSLETLSAAARAIASGADVTGALDVVDSVWGMVAGGHWWMWPLFAAVLLLVGPCMTPSTIDYVAATPSLVGYGIGAVVITRWGAMGMIVAAAAAGVVMVGLQARKVMPMAVGRVLASILLATPVLWLVTWIAARRFGHPPGLLIQSGLVVVTLALALAAAAQIVYVALALVLAALGRPRILWRALKALPGHVLDLVLPFSTCIECRVHYRKRCDGCGRTPDAPAPQKTDAPKPKKSGLDGLLDRARGARPDGAA